MGKFNEKKWRQALEAEMGMPTLDVVRGYASDGVGISVAASALGCPLKFLRGLAEGARIVFAGGARIEPARSPTRAETVKAWHQRRGSLPVGDLAALTGISRKTIERRQELGMPKHRLVATDWPGRQGGRRKK